MKIDIYTLCKNEIKLAPFFVDYWKALADEVEVFVFDGLSNDGTREFFSKYDWVHVIDFEPDALDDFAHIKLKNQCWKKSIGKADFVMVCDFDETIFSYSIEELRSTLELMKDEKYTIVAPLSFNLVCDKFPTYKKGKYLHELAEFGFNDYNCEAKPILFNPNEIEEINFIVGGHCAMPTGNVKWYMPNNLFLIHGKYIGLDFYKNRILRRKISNRNIQMGLLGEKNKKEKELEQEFNEKKSKSFSWFSIKEIFDEYYKIKIDWSPWGGMKV